MGIYGGEVHYTRGIGGAAAARQISRQIASYAASGSRATATRKAKQAAEAERAAALYLKAARAGQVTVYTREPTRGTAAYEAKQMILAAEKQAAEERRAAEAKAAEEKRKAENEQSLTSKALALISLHGKKLALLRFPWIKNFIDEDTVTEDTDIIPSECKEGMFYDAAWYVPCKEGYIEYSLKGHNKCICSARMGDAKAALDQLYATEPGNGNGEGFFSGLGGFGKITDILPLVIGIAIVVALLGMFKK